MLLLLQSDLPLPSTTHVWGPPDYFMACMVTVLGGLRVIEYIRDVIPNKSEGLNTFSAKNVGRLTVESLKSIVRHEVSSTIQPILLKIDETNKEYLRKAEDMERYLHDISLGIKEMVTILNMRSKS